MSVLLLDVVDSTPLSERLGPESFGLLIRELRTIAHATIEAHGGYVAQYLGDGVLAYFGYPSAYFDHARVAIESGLTILHELKGWPGGGWRELSEPVRVRIACHSGSLMAEAPKLGSVGPPAEGFTINICTRLQAEAPPGTLVVSADCLDLAHGFFEIEHLGARSLKGVARKISIFRIKGRRSSNTRFQAAHGSDLLPMVGRASELSFLQNERQRSAKRGRAVVVVGEPGIGKSRLVEEFRLGLEAHDAAYIIAQCEEPISNTAFGPFISLISRDLQINPPRSATDRQQVLAYLERFGLDEGFCRAVELLLGIQSSKGPIPTPVESHEQIRHFLRSFILERPNSEISLILEDIHWSDQSTLKFMSEVILEGPPGGLFVLITARPEGAQQLDSRNVNLLNLRPLDSDEARRALTNLDPRLVPDFIDEIVSRSDGIPLYLEELYRARAREGQRRSDAVADVPERLQGVIWQRLDQLRAHKWVAQLASVGGQSFGIKALTGAVRIVAGVRNAAAVVRDAVRALQRADLATLDGGELRFRHSLIRDAAYESLPMRTRQSWHGVVADVVERHLRGGPFTTSLEVIGRHRSAAGQAPAAARCFVQAGAQAVARFANYEAISLFTAAIEECAKIPDPAKARDIEIEIRVMLNAPIIADSGWAAADLETNGKLLLAKCVESNALKEAFSAHRMLFNVAVLRTDITAVDRHVKGLESLLKRRPTAAAATIVDRCVGIQSMFLDGDLSRAETRFARSLSTFDRRKRGVGKDVSDLDGEIVVKSLRSWLKYFAGDLVQAVDQANGAIELAQRIEHPFSLAYALCLGGSALLSAGEVDAAADAGAKARALAVKSRMSYWMAYADILIGGALIVANVESGLQALADARKAYLSTGANLILPWILSLEAEGWRKAGDPGKALALLRQGESHKARLFVPLVNERLAALS